VSDCAFSTGSLISVMRNICNLVDSIYLSESVATSFIALRQPDLVRWLHALNVFAKVSTSKVSFNSFSSCCC